MPSDESETGTHWFGRLLMMLLIIVLFASIAVLSGKVIHAI